MSADSLLHAPSEAQLAAWNARPARRPVVLVYRWRGADVGGELGRLARRHGGRLGWRGVEEQVLIGPMTLGRHCARLHFRERTAALAFVLGEAHRALVQGLESLEVVAVGEQPVALRLMIAFMARVLPWLPYDRSREDGPEPGAGSSVMPTEAAMQTFLAHPVQAEPVVMLNFLRFRERAQYDPPREETLSGQAAYYRYGKVAFDTLHRLGARALFVGRYQQVLIGNDGDPGRGLWHEFAMVRYPGRASFKLMTELVRYRRAMPDRQAGLAENGQGLIVAVDAR